MTPSTVSEWHRGESLPSFDKLDAIAAVLGVTVSDVFHDETQPVSLQKGTVLNGAAAALSRPQIQLHDAIAEVARLAFADLSPSARAELVISQFFPETLERTSSREPRHGSGDRPLDLRAPRARRSRSA